jgi:Tol biopolymer transport system component
MFRTAVGAAIVLVTALIRVALLPRCGQAQNPATPTSAAAQSTATPLPSTPSAAAPAASAKEAASANDKLVLELAGNQWFEGPLERVAISPKGDWALVNRRGVPRNVQLYSLKTGREDPLSLIADLNRVDNAVFCGRKPLGSLGTGGLARLGERVTEIGWFLPHADGEDLSSLPADAVPVCAAEETEFAYYRANSSEQAIFVNEGGRVRDYGISGHLTAMVFSPNGNYLYLLLFLPNGESSLVRVDVNTGTTRAVASHLDASPLPGRMAISDDGRKLFLPLASDGAPNNEARHQPQADRWLKIYELDLMTGSRRRVVESAGQDNDSPRIVGDTLYWVRTLYQPAIALVPSIGGEAKTIVPGGELPMWSPDNLRIGFFFGGARQADWGLDLDDGVVALDAQGNLGSQPTVIVSGYGEDFSPAWSPDGKWIAFHSHRSFKAVPQYGDPDSTDDVYLRRADDVHAPEIRLTDFGWETGPAYWSPDGKKLLFSSWDHNGQPGIDKLWVLNMDTEMGRALDASMLTIPEVRSASWASWSPDGREIAIEDNRGGEDRTLWTVHADGSHAEKLLDYQGTTYDGLDWTPDGKAIVFSALSEGRLQMFGIPSIGGTPVKLTHDSANLLHPKVSPDGRWIACTRLTQSKQVWERKLDQP